MKQINILIVDDEKDAIEGLTNSLNDIAGKSILFFTSKTVDEGLEILRIKNIDLIFLDIHLGKENGFQLLENMPTLNSPAVIFVSAYEQYAIKALNSAALYYLLKPVVKSELTIAFNCFLDRQVKAVQLEQLQVLLENLQPGNELSRVALPVGYNLEMLPRNQILRCESDSNYTYVYSLLGKKYTLVKTLKEVEQYLPPIFFRIHRSHIVNLNMVKKVNKKESNVTLVDGTLLPIADERKHALLDLVRLTH